MTLPYRRRVHVAWYDDNGYQRIHIDTRREGRELRELAESRVREHATGEVRGLLLNAPPAPGTYAAPTEYKLKGIVCRYDIRPDPDGVGLYRNGDFLGAYRDHREAETQIQLERWKDEVR